MTEKKKEFEDWEKDFESRWDNWNAHFVPYERKRLCKRWIKKQLIDARVDELGLLNSTIETALEQNLNKVETLTYNSVILKNKLRVKELRGK